MRRSRSRSREETTQRSRKQRGGRQREEGGETTNRRRGGRHDDEGGNDATRAEAETREEEAEMRDEEDEEAEAGNCAEQGETTQNTTRGRGETTNKRGGDMTWSRPSSRASRLCSCLFFSILNYIVCV